MKSLVKLVIADYSLKYQVIIGDFSDNNENPEAPLPRETIPLEQDLEQLETQLREVNANQEQLNKNFLELTEVKFYWSKSYSSELGTRWYNSEVLPRKISASLFEVLLIQTVRVTVFQ